MKKIRFGSFPLVEIPKGDRRCLDKYLIKSFSDNISISDAMRNLSITKNLMYITPDSLMRTWLNDSSGVSVPKDVSRNAPDRADASGYDDTLKRAFYILKEFYKNVSHKPFYKEFVYYPIYIERVERLQPQADFGSSAKQKEQKDIMMNYSFIILSNDLDNNLKIDEIRYDSNATLNFLYMFSEFFADPLSTNGKSLNDLDTKDLNFIVKFYQFVEKSGKSPIDVTLDIYKFLGILDKLIKQPTQATKGEIERELNKYFKGTDLADFKKYQPIMKTRFLTEISKSGSSDQEKYRSGFTGMMNALFNEKGFVNLFSDIESDDLGLRKSIVYNSNKYQEIIGLAEELVKFNKESDVRAIVVEDQIDFDFKLEQGNYGLDFQSQVVSQKYQEYFKKFIDEIKTLITLQLQRTITTHYSEVALTGTSDPDPHASMVATINKNISKLEDELIATQKEIATNTIELNKANARMERSDFDSSDSFGKMIVDTQRELSTLVHSDKINLITTERAIVDLEAEIIRLGAVQTTRNAIPRTFTKDIFETASAEILEAMSPDIAFLYDDLKDLFMSDVLVQQQLDSANNLSNAADFDKIKNNSSDVFRDLKDFYETLQIDFDTIGETMYNAVLDFFVKYESIYTNTADDFINRGKDALHQSIRKSFVDYFIKPENKAMFISKYSTEIKERAVGIVIKLINRIFQKKRYSHKIEQDKRLSELHPLIKKLLKNPQNFRSYILDFDTVENLYQLWFITQTKKFTSGIAPRLPRKLNSPKNRIEFVLEEMLGLLNNPVWIISTEKVYLSMPDYLSLTNTKILSSIPKEELKDICRIDAKDYWDENKLGSAARSKVGEDTTKQKEAVQSIKDDIKDLEDGKSSTLSQGEKIAIDKKIAQKKRSLKQAQNDLEAAKKKKTSNKELPNLFSDFETTDELLTQNEKDGLMKAKDTIIDGAQLPTNKNFDDQLADKLEQDFEDSLKAEEDKEDKADEDSIHRKDREEQDFDDPFARRDRRDR